MNLTPEQAARIQRMWDQLEPLAHIPLPDQPFQWAPQVCGRRNGKTARNPEQDVVDDIDRLVDESLEYGEYVDDTPKCELCQYDWHGLPGDGYRGCPGAYATDDEKTAWRESNDSGWSFAAQLPTDAQLYDAARQLLFYGEVYFVPTDSGCDIIPADRVIRHSDGRVEITNPVVAPGFSGVDYVQFDELRNT